MSGELDKVQTILRTISEKETSPDALRIIKTLTDAVEGLRAELLYERLPEHDEVPDDEVIAFKRRVYDILRRERATDLVRGYNRAYFAEVRPLTRLAMVQALITIANEQKVTIPALWQTLLDSRGNL